VQKPTSTPAESTVPVEPVAPAEPIVPLTSVKGVGDARARLLREAGILTANDLARSESKRVLAALANSPAATLELAASLVSGAVTALTGQKPENVP
jgi:predicted RecB family nuclease